MSTIKHAAYAETIQTATIGGNFNSRVTAAYTDASSAIANQTDLHLFADFELALGSFTALAGGYVGLYILPSVDGGTTFPDGGGSVVPAESLLAGIFPLTAGASAKVVTIANVSLPPTSFKIVLGNFSGATFAASGNTLRYRRHNIDVA